MTILRIRTVFTGVAGAPWYSNLYFGPPADPTNAQQCVDAVGAFWATLATNLRLGVAFNVEGDVPAINEADGKITDQITVTPVTGGGTNAGDPLPPYTQALIRLSTNAFVNGRRVRGRIFVPGQVESNNVSGNPAGAFVTGVAAAAQALINNLDTELVVWARPFEGDPLSVPPKPARLGTYAGAVTATMWTAWSVLRSRRD